MPPRLNPVAARYPALAGVAYGGEAYAPTRSLLAQEIEKVFTEVADLRFQIESMESEATECSQVVENLRVEMDEFQAQIRTLTDSINEYLTSPEKSSDA